MKFKIPDNDTPFENYIAIDDQDISFKGNKGIDLFLRNGSKLSWSTNLDPMQSFFYKKIIIYLPEAKEEYNWSKNPIFENTNNKSFKLQKNNLDFKYCCINYDTDNFNIIYLLRSDGWAFAICNKGVCLLKPQNKSNHYGLCDSCLSGAFFHDGEHFDDLKITHCDPKLYV